jgi:ferritin
MHMSVGSGFHCGKGVPLTFSERSKQAINAQLTKELEASYAYLAMAEYCESRALHGFGAWLRAQSDEERGHAMKFHEFIQDRGERVHFDTLPAPTGDFSSVLEVFEAALENEQAVTRAIHDLYSLAEDEKDFTTQAFLNWFLLEQVEEERTVQGIIDWITEVGDTKQGLYLLDRELGGGLEGALGDGGGGN